MSLQPTPLVPTRQIKVMICDDSAVVRGLITRWLSVESDMLLVGVAVDGVMGIKRVAELQPDVLILDIEMPNMGGLEALPKMLQARPGLKVLMASTLTQKGADVTLRAMQLGAADFVPKPESSRIGGAEGFKEELFLKIRALCGRYRPPLTQQVQTPSNQPTGARPSYTPNPTPPASNQDIRHVAPVLRAPSIGPKRISALFVGASTGGPPALTKFLTGLGADWKLPVFVVQHMPAAFTTILASHLDKALPQTVIEAKDGLAVLPNHIYIAPGDFHLTVKGSAQAPILKLDQDPQVNWCRPAVDPLFKSAVELFGKNTLGVVLTGMGSDGRDGARSIVNAGGSVFVQDEASSVVWGMPGSIAEAGLAELIKPIDGLALACKAFSKGEKL